MSPFYVSDVSHCLPMSLFMYHVCLPCVSFLNSTVVTQSSLSIPSVLRSSLLCTYFDVERLPEFKRMKTTGFDSAEN